MRAGLPLPTTVSPRRSLGARSDLAEVPQRTVAARRGGFMEGQPSCTNRRWWRRRRMSALHQPRCHLVDDRNRPNMTARSPSNWWSLAERVHNPPVRRGGRQSWLFVAGLGGLALVAASCSSGPQPDALQASPAKAHTTSTTAAPTTTTTAAPVTTTAPTPTTVAPTTSTTAAPQAPPQSGEQLSTTLRPGPNPIQAGVAPPTTTATTCEGVPNVLGEPYGQAVNELSAVGFRPSGGPPAPAPDAAVTSEVPAGGACVPAGTGVQLAAPGP